MEESDPQQPVVTGRLQHTNAKLKAYHQMLAEYYDPKLKHPLKANVLQLDIQNP